MFLCVPDVPNVHLSVPYVLLSLAVELTRVYLTCTCVPKVPKCAFKCTLRTVVPGCRADKGNFSQRHSLFSDFTFSFFPSSRVLSF